MYWVKGLQGSTRDGVTLTKDTYFVATKKLTTEKEIEGLIAITTYKVGIINMEVFKEHVNKMCTESNYKVTYIDSGWEISIYKNPYNTNYEMCFYIPSDQMW